MGKSNRVLLLAIIALVAISAIVIALYIPPSTPQPGGFGCTFYSAQSQASIYTVYATLSNNSTSPVTIERVFFDSSELAYSDSFVSGVGGIWSCFAGGTAAKTTAIGNFSTLLLASQVSDPNTSHNVRVVTNAGTLEFAVEKRMSSLVFNNYHVYVGPGIDYITADFGNVGNATGNVVQVAMDGTDYEHVSVSPLRYQWSMTAGGAPSPFIGAGQQAQLTVNISGICHSCTHILRITCVDGSYAEFTFKPW